MNNYNRGNAGPILNLTLRGMIAAFKNASASEAASNAAALAARIDRSWEATHGYGEKLRADTTRPQLEAEAVLAQYAQGQIKTLSPAIETTMGRLTSRRGSLEAHIDGALRETDPVQSIRGMEIRSHLRSLSETERAELLKDHQMAKAAVCAPPGLSGCKPDHYASLREGVIAKEFPSQVQEIADVDMGINMLVTASQALLSNTLSYTDPEAVGQRAQAPQAE